MLAILHSIITNGSDGILDDNTFYLMSIFFPRRKIPPIPFIVRHLSLAMNEERIPLQVPKDITAIKAAYTMIRLLPMHGERK